MRWPDKVKKKKGMLRSQFTKICVGKKLYLMNRTPFLLVSMGVGSIVFCGCLEFNGTGNTAQVGERMDSSKYHQNL